MILSRLFLSAALILSGKGVIVAEDISNPATKQPGQQLIASSTAVGTWCFPIALSEQLDDTVIAVGKWVSGVPAAGPKAGSTSYEIVDAVQKLRLLKSESELRLLNQLELPKIGSRLTVADYQPKLAGTLSLLYRTSNQDKAEWLILRDISPAGWEYVKGLPGLDQPAATRLRYVVRYLVHEDPLVSMDVYWELDKAQFSDLKSIGGDLPREFLRKQLAAKVRSNLYGKLLGICGTVDDVQLLQRMMLEPSENAGPLIDGVIIGYLRLTGEKGLEFVDGRLLRNKRINGPEVSAAMRAIRFLWKNDPQIPSERLRQSMRILLDRPELTYFVIEDLGRMKDWSVQDRVVAFYDTAPKKPQNFDVRWAIIRYLVISTKDGAQKFDPATNQWVDVPEVDLPAHVVKARKSLVDLEKRDPETTKQAKHAYNPQVPADRSER